MIADLLLALLALLGLFALPFWPWSRAWGFFGAGAVGALLLAVLLLVWERVL